MNKDIRSAKQRILNDEWDDIVDEYETNVLTENYKVVDIWEI